MLDNVPLATPLGLALLACALVAYLSNDLSTFQAIVGGSVGLFGAGKLGEARNGAGRGLRK